MAPIKVGVNGFGRIGRLSFRIAWDTCPEIELVHINETPGALESSAYLLEFDSVHGRWPHKIETTADAIVIDGKKVTYSMHKECGDIPWEKYGVELVLECTGEFLTTEKISPQFNHGVKKILVSAPVKSEGILNIVVGCNDKLYDPAKNHIVTAASCTTNCLAPVVKVIKENLGIKHGCITTVHNVTNTQTLVDACNSKKSDLRRARAGLMSLAPTSTGSATAVALIFPDLKGKLNGLAVRVPLLNGSLTDCVFEVNKETTVEEVNAMLKAASLEGDLKGILGFEEKPLVSVDYINDNRSGIVDALSTQVIDKSLVKIYAWYDNEWGYSCRMVDIARMIVKSM
uniref:Glyceraldehyde-3-phosphate dehydrogenase n=1 Tax=Pyramimonas obovata TaxID=1411642 RepID=A0A7S0R109_9CHLO